MFALRRWRVWFYPHTFAGAPDFCGYPQVLSVVLAAAPLLGSGAAATLPDLGVDAKRQCQGWALTAKLAMTVLTAHPSPVMRRVDDKHQNDRAAALQ